MRYKVYVYTNKTNGKKYVGQTMRTLKERSGKGGCEYKNCKRFWNAINKYGWDNFYPEIIADNLTQEEADKVEIESIKKYKTCDDRYGYNIRHGGSLQGARAMKPVVQFTLDFEYVDRHESLRAAKRKTGIDASHISTVCNGIRNYKKATYKQSGGYIWMWESDYINGNYDKQEILFEINKDFEHPNSKKVVQLSVDMEYISTFKNICEAARKTGCRRNSINDNCTHRLKTACGYIWMYEEEYRESNINKDKISFNAKRKGKRIVQLTHDFKFVNLFPSAADASRSTGIDRSYIGDTCKGKYHFAKGFKFMYLNDYIENVKHDHRRYIV